MAESQSWADIGVKFVDVVGGVAGVALKIGGGLEAVDRVLGPVAGFIPYYSQAMAVVKIADPILAKIAAAAPIAAAGLAAARPSIDAVQAQTEAALPHVKELLALAINEAPDRPEDGLTAADIDDVTARVFAGPMLLGRPWTAEETQAWWDKAQGPLG